MLRMDTTKRTTLLGSAAVLLGLACSAGSALALDGELVMINWLGGAQGEMMEKLQEDFEAKNPGVEIRNVIPQASGDARGGIRAVLMGGEQADLLINTWPAFRAELIEAGMILPLDASYESNGWGEKLGESWQALSTVGEENYGVTYTFGDRSGIWYRTDTMAKAEIDPPATYEEFLSGFGALNAAGVTPISVPAKVWAHAEWFESLLLRTAGADYMTRLASGEASWTDPEVRTALSKWQEMLQSGCCDDGNTMLALDWDISVDAALKTGDAAYVLMGMWLNTRAKQEYGETPGEDFNIVQFPAFDMGHDRESMVDAKELNMLSAVENREAAEAFMGYMLTADAAGIMAEYGLASPSTEVDPSIYDPVIQKSVNEVTSADKLQFVLGDLLPGDLGGEYRIALQRFLQDPSDETIDAVTQQLALVAQGAY
ncbi:carbohydrate ABC transporter substrate-binding protein (CUT1 family) [Primorskyibacter sedentarius]|uniref:Carbohydrate ABC transporter substrate-binding protein (CUT1 family) n=1 Tax=Primorskyibacter sedentarius TaxID=745311 RepID=A0A4R3JAA9_9RHOB|nr:extracellular solute-binding protein [Primorskyibacter sedentarius]TCS61550.1 carbohydrate ABC transporter substrate-binding protein (CUT1 family) [Primorskyibacter sedentarius]